MIQNSEDGALPGLRAALDKDALSGMYFGPSGLFESSGQPYEVKPSKSAYDDVVAKKLCSISEELTGVYYDFKSYAD